MGVPPQVWHAGDAAGAAAAPPLLCCLLLPRDRQLLRQAYGRLGKGCGLRRRAGALQSGGSGKGAQARCRGRGAALRAPECRRCCWLVGGQRPVRGGPVGSHGAAGARCLFGLHGSSLLATLLACIEVRRAGGARIERLGGGSAGPSPGRGTCAPARPAACTHPPSHAGYTLISIGSRV